MRLLAVLLFAALAVAQEKPQLIVQRGHGGSSAISGVAWSADGRFLLTGSWDFTAVLWDVATGKQLRRFSGHTKQITSVALSGDGRYAYTCSDDRSVRFWEVGTGREVRRIEVPEFATMAYSPGGRRLLVWSCTHADRSSSGSSAPVKPTLFHERSGKVVGRLPVEILLNAVYSADGKRVLAMCGDNTVRLYNAKGKKLKELKGHAPPGGIDREALSLALSHDNRRALTASSDGLVILWNAMTGRELRRFRVPGGGPVAFSPDGRLLLLGRQGRVYDAESGKLRLMLNKDTRAGAIAGVFSPDGTRIATARWSVKIRETATGKLTARFGKGRALDGWGMDISPDGSKLLVAAGGNCALWDLSSGRQSRYAKLDSDAVFAVEFSPNGKRFLAAGSKLWILDASTWKKTVETGKPMTMGAAFSPDGKTVATSYGGLKIWDATTGGLRSQMAAGGPQAWSPDGRYLAGSLSGTVIVLDVGSGKEFRQLASLQPSATVFYPDGKRLIVGQDSGRCRAWNIQTGRPVREFKGHTARVTSARFSPDGKLLLTTSMDTTARIWNRRTGRLQVSLEGHSGFVRAGAFVGGGARVATCGRDGVRVWETKTGKELCRLINFKDGAWAVLDADGRFDASNGGDVEGLHWVFRNEPISLAQLKERYYDPGLLAKHLGYNQEPLRKVSALGLPKLFPMTTLQAPTEKKPSLGIKLKDRGGGIGRVVVKVNGKELTDDARGDKAGSKAGSLYLEVPMTGDVRLLPGETNLLEVEVYNAEGYLRSRGMRATFKAPGEKSEAPPRLHAIVAGTADYAGEEIDLRYATKDAADFASALTVAASGLLGPKRVSVTLLRDADRGELVKALKDARRKLKARDILVLYLAGHGVNVAGDDGDFFYLTREAASAELVDPEVRKRAGISSRQLTELLKRIPALKQVLILDTCAAGGFIEKLTEKRNVPSSQIRALERLKDRTGLHILAGCAADRVSYEATRFAQGLLTHSLLLGMRGAALREDEFVDVLTLFNFTVDQVPQLAGSIGGIQRPVIASPKASASFDIGKLDDDAKEQVPLRSPLPLVLRSNFQEEEEFEDVLGLGKLVDKALRSASARGGEAPPLVFVDARDLPAAYRILGRYRIEGDKVSVAVRLTGGVEAEKFTVTGTKQDAADLAKRILAEIERRIG